MRCPHKLWQRFSPLFHRNGACWWHHMIVPNKSMTKAGWWSLWILGRFFTSFLTCWGINWVDLSVENPSILQIFSPVERNSLLANVCVKLKKAFWFYRPLRLKEMRKWPALCWEASTSRSLHNTLDMNILDMFSSRFITDCLFTGFNWIRAATVWTSLLVLMLHGRPSRGWPTTFPVSVSRLMVHTQTFC